MVHIDFLPVYKRSVKWPERGWSLSEVCEARSKSTNEHFYCNALGVKYGKSQRKTQFRNTEEMKPFSSHKFHFGRFTLRYGRLSSTFRMKIYWFWYFHYFSSRKERIANLYSPRIIIKILISKYQRRNLTWVIPFSHHVSRHLFQNPRATAAPPSHPAILQLSPHYT